MGGPDEITDGSELGPIEVGLNAIQVGMRQRRPMLVLAVAAVVFVLSLVVRVLVSGGPVNLVAGLLVTASFVVLLAVPGLVLTTAPGAFYADRLGTALGARRVFATPDGIGLRTAVRHVLSRDAPPGTARTRPTAYLVAEDARLSVWARQGTTLVPLLVVPRSRVTAIDARTVYDSGRPANGVAVGILRNGGGTTTLPLGIQNFRLAGPANLARAERESIAWLLAWPTRFPPAPK